MMRVVEAVRVHRYSYFLCKHIRRASSNAATESTTPFSIFFKAAQQCSIGGLSSGKELLDAAWNVIQSLQYTANNIASFLETEKNEAMLAFYHSNGFREFDIKTIIDDNGEQHELVQLLRFA